MKKYDLCLNLVRMEPTNTDQAGVTRWHILGIPIFSQLRLTYTILSKKFFLFLFFFVFYD